MRTNRPPTVARLTASIAASLVAAALAACAAPEVAAPTAARIEATATAVSPTRTPRSTATPVATLRPTRPSALPPSPSPLSPTALPEAPDQRPVPKRAGPVDLWFIDMIDENVGWAEGNLHAGDRTRILRTTDGGATWRDVTPAVLGSYGRHGFFLDGQVAWVNAYQGNQTWHTDDGGASWVSIGSETLMGDAWFNDGQHGWKLWATVWGLSYVQFDIESFSTTTDGGVTWQEATPPGGSNSAYMAYPDPQVAWAVRAGFAKTIGGIPNLVLPYSVTTTSDGGQTWTTYQMPVPDDTTRFDARDGGTYLGGVGNCEFHAPLYSSTAIWKLALACEEAGWLYTSATLGKTWIISPLPPGGPVADIHFVDATHGWLLSRDAQDNTQSDLYRTENGGDSWSLIKHTGWAGAQLEFVSETNGWAIACDQIHCLLGTSERQLLQTTDGGGTWQGINPQLRP